jgi:hypothetical protein
LCLLLLELVLLVLLLLLVVVVVVARSLSERGLGVYGRCRLATAAAEVGGLRSAERSCAHCIVCVCVRVESRWCSAQAVQLKWERTQRRPAAEQRRRE